MPCELIDIIASESSPGRSGIWIGCGVKPGPDLKGDDIGDEIAIMEVVPPEHLQMDSALLGLGCKTIEAAFPLDLIGKGSSLPIAFAEATVNFDMRPWVATCR